MVVSGRGGSMAWNAEEVDVSAEFLLVIFPEDRDVLADGDRVGVTNHTILMPADEYEVTLGGTGYVPASQDIVVAGTSLMRPKVVSFAPGAAAVVADIGAGGVAAGLPPDAGLSQPSARGRGRQSRTG